jgi:hypothetical protein
MTNKVTSDEWEVMSEIQAADIQPGAIIETDDGEIGIVESSYSNLNGTALFAGELAAFHFSEVYKIYHHWDAVPIIHYPTEFIDIEL